MTGTGFPAGIPDLEDEAEMLVLLPGCSPGSNWSGAVTPCRVSATCRIWLSNTSPASDRVKR